MKRLLFVLLTAFAMMGQLKAQESFTGIRTGLLFIEKQQTGDFFDLPTSGDKLSVGFRLSAYRSIVLNKYLSFQPEIGVSQYRIETEILESMREMRFRTIDMMPSIKFYPVKGLNISTGPQASFLVDVKHFNKATERELEEPQDFFDFVDFGFNIGIGYELDKAISFGINYYYGLSNMRESNAKEEYTNQYFGLLMGISL